MTGFAGLMGVFLPLIVTAFSAWGPFRGRNLWTFSLGVHLVAWTCFLFVVIGFYTGALSEGFTVLSPTILAKSPWSGDTALRWGYSSSVLSLAACSVLVSFHFIARDLLEHSRASVAGLSCYLSCLLGALGADHPLLFCVFLAGSIVPRLVFVGMDARDGRIDAVKETAFLSVIALLSFLVCVLAFAEPFRASLSDWFRIEGGNRIALPGSIGISLLLLAASISAGVFPFHGNARRVFAMASMERAVPLALQPLFGFGLLFRFGLVSFPQEFRDFSPALLNLFAVGVAYCAVGFLGSGSARGRVFWLQQLLSCFVAVGFFSLTVKGWHGALVLLFFQSMAVPFLLLVLSCHERRPGMPPIREFARCPAFALSTALAALFALLLPVSIGFYGVLLVTWSLVGLHQWPLPFVILSMPLIALAGVRIMYFRLGEEPVASGATREFTDLKRDELIALLPLGFTLFVLGLLPKLLMSPMGVSVATTLRGLGFKD